MTNTSTVSKKKIPFLYIILVVCLAAVVVFSIILIRELSINNQSRQYYEDLTTGIARRPRNTGIIRPEPPPEQQPPSTTETYVPPEEIYEEPEWVPYVDFDAVNELLPGIIGWIRLEGTVLDYPIMQTTDNDYFLTHLSDGTRHRSGSIFIDYRANPDFSDRNTLMFGHMTATEEMFGLLKHYRTQSFYEQNIVMFIHTPQTDYALMIFAAYLLDSGYEVPPTYFEDEYDFDAHIKDIQRRSLIKSNVNVEPNDRIVSLCTCAYDYANARLIIVGRLVEL